jgi:alkanesulfonate monooxygenase SsuD/methylene tetrahydromethanopterin reductase-like flavin-dependent oxidoreductase (luciferase family)
VAEKIARIHDEVGGFGHLLVFGFDYVEHPEAWHRSLQLLAHEVLPRVRQLSPAA